MCANVYLTIMSFNIIIDYYINTQNCVYIDFYIGLPNLSMIEIYTKLYSFYM